MKFLGVEFSIKRVGKGQPKLEHEKESAKYAEPEEDKPKVQKMMGQRLLGNKSGATEGVKQRSAGGFTLKTFRRTSPMEQIVFPEPPDPDDVWQQQALLNLLNKVQTMFDRGWISICEIDAIVTKFNIPQNGAAKAARRKLAELHCVDSDKMVPGLWEQIPGLMTCVFTGGAIYEQE
uniref:Uncharacterized protein n=1 Tax=Pseudomonas phage HRDY3 TaxID=3236930 RepID=A0AB39CDF0_9VIRU